MGWRPVYQKKRLVNGAEKEASLQDKIPSLLDRFLINLQCTLHVTVSQSHLNYARW